MKLAMQFISNDKTVSVITVQDSKDFILTHVIKKAFDLMVDDVVELSTENEPLKSKILLRIKIGQNKLKLSF